MRQGRSARPGEACGVIETKQSAHINDFCGRKKAVLYLMCVTIGCP